MERKISSPVTHFQNKLAGNNVLLASNRHVTLDTKTIETFLTTDIEAAVNANPKPKRVDQNIGIVKYTR